MEEYTALGLAAPFKSETLNSIGISVNPGSLYVPEMEKLWKHVYWNQMPELNKRPFKIKSLFKLKLIKQFENKKKNYILI